MAGLLARVGLKMICAESASEQGVPKPFVKVHECWILVDEFFGEGLMLSRTLFCL